MVFPGHGYNFFKWRCVSRTTMVDLTNSLVRQCLLSYNYRLNKKNTCAQEWKVTQRNRGWGLIAYRRSSPNFLGIVWPPSIGLDRPLAMYSFSVPIAEHERPTQKSRSPHQSHTGTTLIFSTTGCTTIRTETAKHRYLAAYDTCNSCCTYSFGFKTSEFCFYFYLREASAQLYNCRRRRHCAMILLSHTICSSRRITPLCNALWVMWLELDNRIIHNTRNLHFW